MTPVTTLNIEREALAKSVADRLHNIATKLAELRPDVEKLWAEFDALETGDSIMGCRTKKQFCEEVLHRTYRSVRYMLTGGNNNRGQHENVSCPELAEPEGRKDTTKPAEPPVIPSIADLFQRTSYLFSGQKPEKSSGEPEPAEPEGKRDGHFSDWKGRPQPCFSQEYVGKPEPESPAEPEFTTEEIAAATKALAEELGVTEATLQRSAAAEKKPEPEPDKQVLSYGKRWRQLNALFGGRLMYNGLPYEDRIAQQIDSLRILATSYLMPEQIAVLVDEMTIDHGGDHDDDARLRRIKSDPRFKQTMAKLEARSKKPEGEVLPPAEDVEGKAELEGQ